MMGFPRGRGKPREIQLMGCRLNRAGVMNTQPDLDRSQEKRDSEKGKRDVLHAGETKSHQANLS